MLTNEQRIGLFFIVGLVLLFIAIELTLGLGFLHRRYPLYALFPDVQGLDVGAVRSFFSGHESRPRSFLLWFYRVEAVTDAVSKRGRATPPRALGAASQFLLVTPLGEIAPGFS